MSAANDAVSPEMSRPRTNQKGAGTAALPSYNISVHPDVSPFGSRSTILWERARNQIDIPTSGVVKPIFLLSFNWTQNPFPLATNQQPANG